MSDPPRTFSTGHGGGFLDRTLSLLRQYRHNRSFAAHDYGVFQECRAAFERHAGRPITGARVLDIGCGQRFPVTLLFRAFGAETTGIDTDVVEPRLTPSACLRMIRANGVERFVKTAVRRAIFDGAYFRELGLLADRPLPFRDLDLKLMDARALDFPPAHFDLVHSNAAFEHMADVPRVLDEMARTLKPGGFAVVGVHLFPSLSGGHHLDWASPDASPSARVPPWDHLRENLHPAHPYLNRWREREFLAAFEQRFEILEHRSWFEGEKLLTPEIERELAPAWTRDELLKRSIRVTLRLRSSE